MDVLNLLAAARLIAAKKMPYFAPALFMLIPVERPGMGTVGVTDKAVMYFDPEFVAKFDPQTVAGLLLHEIGHLVRNHSQRATMLGISLEQRGLWNIAGDLCINQDLKAANVTLPAEGMFIEKFKFPPNLSTEQYFDLLRKMAEKAPQRSSSSISPNGCGSCSGHKPDGEPDDGKGGGDKEGDKKPGKGSAKPGDADGDVEEGRNEGELSRMRQAVAEKVNEIAKGKQPGSVPAGLAVWAEEALRPPKVRWQDKLQRVASSAVAIVAGQVDYRYDRQGRRQACVGYGMGKPVLPRMVKPVPEIAWVHDTSGSMHGTHGAGLAEVEAIVRKLQARVTAIAVDCAAAGPIKDVKGGKQLGRQLQGGGGTSFIPGVEAAMALKPKPNVIIYYTDAYGEAPKNPPPGVKFIWLINNAQAEAPASWGEVIRIDD